MVAGIDPEKVVNCHGSFATATCVRCKKQVDCDAVREDILNSKIPLCTVCNDDEAFMKPDIVFFGESLPDRFDHCLFADVKKIDLLLVMGSSLQVKPVALVPDFINDKDCNIPQILINRELVAQPHEFDYAYLGDCDSFVIELCEKLNWTINGLLPEKYKKTKEVAAAATETAASSTTTTTTTKTTVINKDENGTTSTVIREETTTTTTIPAPEW
eukprot:TRINITY_DN3232_c0_g1_i1.p1 TRINITY_DN3232_c0_g1~~TRINITY_DN3232_c0_g1_i1.p1  ORF type:complete len:251 (+),score=48.26 TRINITY_DN3232_c0_g1_i1:110-754(+)